MDRSRKVFLTAEWRHLAFLNFEIDPDVLRPLVPAGTELDDWQGRTFVSLVGFLFLNTRVLGLAVPFHRDFEEVNLRFYVRRVDSDGVRRGVVFVREFVPSAAVALAARLFYDEQYLAVPMSHTIEPTGVRYRWTFKGRENAMQVTVDGDALSLAPGSHEEFITEHYWGYTQRPGRTFEYRVEHPRWRVWNAASARVDCDATQLYGSRFVDCLCSTPVSAFLADGSEVTVFRGVPLL